jgi:mannose-6-phosphate isomerase
MNAYPLQFKPEMKERVWGGRALGQFGFDLPDGPTGEAWTIADHPNGTSTVINGELAGRGLDEVRALYGAQWFGSKFTAQTSARFPLLIKLLDCNDDLSVQVHPKDDYSRLPAGELGKTEMWYVLDAKPGAKIICGLKSDWTRESLEAAIAEHRIMDCMHEVTVEVGDCFYIPAGTLHALCAGVLVAEIQQNSDTTYRLYDYNRPGLDGKPRELHIEDSLNVINYENAGASRKTTQVAAPNSWLTLVESPYFVTEKAEVQGAWSQSTTPESFIILIVATGNGALHWGDQAIQLKGGDGLLLPATLGEYKLEGTLTVLRSYLP